MLAFVQSQSTKFGGAREITLGHVVTGFAT